MYNNDVLTIIVKWKVMRWWQKRGVWWLVGHLPAYIRYYVVLWEWAQATSGPSPLDATTLTVDDMLHHNFKDN